MTELSNMKITSNSTKKPKNAEDCVTKKMNNKKTKKAVEETVQKMLLMNVENTVAELKPKVLKLSQTKKVVKKLKNTLKSAVGKTTMSNPSNAKPPLSVENTKIQLPKNMMTAVIKEVEEKMSVKSKRLSESLPRVENNNRHPKKAPGVNNLISAANEMTVDSKTLKPKNLLKSANTKVFVVKENQTHKKSVESKRTNPADIESVNVQTQTYRQKSKRSLKRKPKSLASGNTKAKLKSTGPAGSITVKNIQPAKNTETFGNSLGTDMR